MKTKSLLSQKSSSKPSSTADAEIFIVHRLLLVEKPLSKTRTLGPKNHPRSLVLRQTLTSSAHIDYSWQINRWQKLSPCSPKNHPRNPVLRRTLKSSLYIDYCCLKNRWRKLSPWDPKIIQEAQFRDDADIFSAHRLLLTEKYLMKTESLLSQKSSSKSSSTADAEIFNVHRLMLDQKLLMKTRTLGPKKSSKKPSSTAGWEIIVEN
jgi:hypothetical protein